MVGVLEGFATIAIIVAVGWVLADRRILDEGAQGNLSRLAFYVASPALLLTVMQRTSLDAVLSANLATSLISFGIVVTVYLLIARFRWRQASLGSRIIGGLSAGYVNAGNLGIPIALYVLGDVSLMAPTLLMQLLLITPIAMALLDADARGARPTLGRSLGRVLRNPVTIGADATLETVKAKYKLLVKQHHPDANGGDRSTEDRLIEIIKAYNYLKTVVRGA